VGTTLTNWIIIWAGYGYSIAKSPVDFPKDFTTAGQPIEDSTRTTFYSDAVCDDGFRVISGSCELNLELPMLMRDPRLIGSGVTRDKNKDPNKDIFRCLWAFSFGTKASDLRAQATASATCVPTGIVRDNKRN
jgi:hypothetical protein